MRGRQREQAANGRRGYAKRRSQRVRKRQQSARKRGAERRSSLLGGLLK